MPACPKCGHRLPQADLDAAEAEMKAFRELLWTHTRNADAKMRRQQRVDAGLTLRQAAKLLGISPTDLTAIEMGREEPTPEMLELMAKTYGVGP
jgi:DNA-binding XRE family transcriptional regulator